MHVHISHGVYIALCCKATIYTVYAACTIEQKWKFAQYISAIPDLMDMCGLPNSAVSRFVWNNNIQRRCWDVVDP